jgi:hypothetical protein
LVVKTPLSIAYQYGNYQIVDLLTIQDENEIEDKMINSGSKDGEAMLSLTLLSRVQPQFCLLTEQELFKLASWLSKGKVKLGDVHSLYHIRTETLLRKFASHDISTRKTKERNSSRES